jgi:hypothetical protein
LDLTCKTKRTTLILVKLSDAYFTWEKTVINMGNTVNLKTTTTSHATENGKLHY